MNEASEKTSPKEQLIRDKIAAGLSRSQAEEVIAAQEAHDAELAKSEKSSTDSKGPKK